jgi:hypothetical protein
MVLAAAFFQQKIIEVPFSSTPFFPLETPMAEEEEKGDNLILFL